MLDIDTVYCGESLKLLKKIDDCSVDLIVTSPPYNLGIKYDNYVDKMPWPEYYDWCRLWLRQCYRVLKDDGRFCLNHYLSCGTANHRSAPLMNLNALSEDIGFKHHGFALWTESSTCKRCAWGSWLKASAPYISSPHEGIDILYKDHWKKDRKGISTITKKEFMEATIGIWKLAPEKHRGSCPAPFPVSLPRRCINMLTYKEDLVLDIFNGDGATCVAAKEGERHYIGIDLSETYCRTARTWLETGKQPDLRQVKRIRERVTKVKTDTRQKALVE